MYLLYPPFSSISLRYSSSTFHMFLPYKHQTKDIRKVVLPKPLLPLTIIMFRSPFGERFILFFPLYIRKLFSSISRMVMISFLYLQILLNVIQFLSLSRDVVALTICFFGALKVVRLIRLLQCFLCKSLALGLLPIYF